MSEYTVMSNISAAGKHPVFSAAIEPDEQTRLRELAKRWLEIASSDVMKERKILWRSIHDLKPIRPVILFETFSVAGFLKDEELSCKNPILRNVEKSLLYGIKQFEYLGDDIVLEPYFRIPWMIQRSDYGVTIEEHHAENSLAYMSNFPIQTIDDINKLKKRTFAVQREETQLFKEQLEHIFGDILPMRIGNFDNFLPEPGFNPFTGNNFIGITMDLFKLIGNENLLLWPYDHPDELHRVLRLLCDDRKDFYHWMEAEGLLSSNTDNQFAGPSSYGYVSDLPADEETPVKMKDAWVWPESQETISVSPEMFGEFFLPYIAEIANMFGLVYYGCCEPVDDRIDIIKKQIPNLRTVSISGWNNFQKIAEKLGDSIVHCKKPNPAFISGKNPDWENCKKDIQQSLDFCKKGNMEIVVRDVYDVGGDISNVKKWVDLAKKTVGI